MDKIELLTAERAVMLSVEELQQTIIMQPEVPVIMQTLTEEAHR